MAQTRTRTKPKKRSKRLKEQRQRRHVGGRRHTNGSRKQRPVCEVCHKPFTHIVRGERTELCSCHERLSLAQSLQLFIQAFGVDAAK